MPSFSLKEGSIYFNNLRCNGHEDRLIDCRKSSYYDFWQYSSAGVRCQFNPSLGNVILSFPFTSLSFL